MTNQEKLIEFMSIKDEQLEVKYKFTGYLLKTDKNDIASWSDADAERVWNTLGDNIMAMPQVTNYFETIAPSLYCIYCILHEVDIAQVLCCTKHKMSCSYGDKHGYCDTTDISYFECPTTWQSITDTVGYIAYTELFNKKWLLQTYANINMENKKYYQEKLRGLENE